MRIYRIQDADGRGPFRPGFSHNWIEGRADHGNLAPWFYEFGHMQTTVRPGEFMGSGCKTRDQLKRWFTAGEYKKLLEFRFSAVCLDVDLILASSEKQLVFVRSLPLNQNVTVIRLY